jgi:hypothetical protein
MSLRQHMRELHPNAPLPRSNDDLIREHMRQHWRFRTSHIHAGANLGPGDRPPGWTTGEDVVMRERG